jgi:hypothetical protein
LGIENTVGAIPLERPAEPTRRIALMRNIKGSGSGFARLYDAADVEQFIRQAQYMVDFTDHVPDRVEALVAVPTYADLSLRQLRWYFTWRAGARAGKPAHCSEAYAKLYLYELLNGIVPEKQPTAEQLAHKIATVWLLLRAHHPRLDRYAAQWFLDFYLARAIEIPFVDLARACGVLRFYPRLLPKAGGASLARELLENSNYKYKNSRFFADNPALLALLERTFPLLLQNLKPHFALCGVQPEELLRYRAERFYYYELFQDAVVRTPQGMPSREVLLGDEDVFRCRGGNWSHARVQSSASGNPAAGLLLRRMELALREKCGCRQRFSLDAAQNQFYCWVGDTGQPQELQNLFLYDEAFADIIEKTTLAALDGALPADGLLPQTRELQRKMEQEPYKTYMQMRRIPGSRDGSPSPRQFRGQAALIAPLEDCLENPIGYHYGSAEYNRLSPEQFRSYLTWRTKARRGEYSAVAGGSAYYELYARELLFGIGAQEPLAELFCLLRHAGQLDRNLERALPERIFCLWLGGDRAQSFTDVVCRHKAQAWFPRVFLLSEDAQADALSLWNQLSFYKLSKSRLYAPQHHGALDGCLREVLTATAAFLRQHKKSLEALLFAPAKRSESWQPYARTFLHPPCKLPPPGTELWLSPREGYVFHSKQWVTQTVCDLQPMASAVAGLLLKRMELRLRAKTNYPYKLHITAGDEKLLQKSFAGRRQLLEMLLSDAFTQTIDDAVDTYFAGRPLPVFSAGRKTGAQKPAAAAAAVAEAPPSKPVKIDFSMLEHIRSQANQTMERLIVEAEEEEPAQGADDGGALPPAEPVHGAVPADFRAALSPQTAAVLAYLQTGEGAPPAMDALVLEQLNEAALEFFGDVIVDTATDIPVLYDEYRSI